MNNATPPIFNLPVSNDDYATGGSSSGSILNEISNPLSSVARLQGKIQKSSVNGHLSIATLLANSFNQPGFPRSSFAIIQSSQMGLTFSQFDLMSRRVAIILSSIAVLPGSEHLVQSNSDGDSVIMFIIEEGYVDEQLIVFIYSVLRLGATYMMVNKEELAADIKAWRELMSLIEPIMVITLTNPEDLPVSIRAELNIVSRDGFQDFEEEEELRMRNENKNNNTVNSDEEDENKSGRASAMSSENPYASAATMIKKMRNSLLILQSSTYQPTAVSSKVIWELAVDMKLSDSDIYCPVPHFKSDIPQGQRTAFIFKCDNSTTLGKSQWCRMGHRTLRNRIAWERQEFPMMMGKGSKEKCCLTFPLDDPRSLVQIFGSFIHGKPLVIGDLFEPSGEELLRRLGKEKHIRRLELTPRRLQLLLDTAVFSGMESHLWNIKTWFVSGESFPPSLGKQFFIVVPPTDTFLIPMYGKPEVCWCASWNMFTDAVDVGKYTVDKGLRLLMGIPMQNTNIFIVDDRKSKFCGAGQKGEICVTGCTVPSNGYCGAPILGRSSMIFPTGDMGRIFIDKFGDRHLVIESPTSSRVLLNGKLIDLGELTRQVKQDAAVVQDAFAFVCRRGRDEPAIVVAVSMRDMKRLDNFQDKIFKMEPSVSSCFPMDRIPILPDGQVNLKDVRAAYFKYLGRCTQRQWGGLIETGPGSVKGKSSKKMPPAADAYAKNVQIVCKAVAFSLGRPVAEIIERNYFYKGFWECGGKPLRAIVAVKSCLCQGRQISVEDFGMANKISDLVTRLGLAEKDELKWSQGVFMAKRSFAYQKLTKNERKELHDILISNVSQVMDPNANDQVSVDKYGAGLLDVFDNPFSVVATRAETKEVIGVALNYKGTIKSHFIPVRLQEGTDLFNGLLQSCKHLIKNIETKQIAKSYLISLKSSALSPTEIVMVTRDLIEESVRTAKEANLKVYLVCSVDPLVQEICCSLLGFETLIEIQCNLYKNKKMQKPFIHLDDHHLAGVYIKRL